METPGEIILLPPGSGSGVVSERPSARRERYAGGWLLAQRSANTREAYRRDLLQFFVWCDELGSGGVDVFDVRRPHLDAYREHLIGRRLVDTTVARKLSAVASFYTYLVDEEVLASNPARKVARPELPRDSTTVGLDGDEADRLTAAADAAGPRAAALTRLLMSTALRVSEVCAADVRDLGRERGQRTIRVVRKGGHRQRIPIPTNSATALDGYLAGRRNGPLLLDERDRRMTRQQVYYLLSKLGRAAGIDKKVTPHVMRHVATTEALDKGATLHDVQTMCGHIDPRTTNRYDRNRHSLDRSPVHLLDRPLPSRGIWRDEAE
uniref:tyrosine-type recombinase/integrase n=1 Tax=Pseudonocardia sp. CA-138482 TaxID=3240023 RepID=UPI003F499D56